MRINCSKIVKSNIYRDIAIYIMNLKQSDIRKFTKLGRRLIDGMSTINQTYNLFVIMITFIL